MRAKSLHVVHILLVMAVPSSAGVACSSTDENARASTDSGTDSLDASAGMGDSARSSYDAGRDSALDSGTTAPVDASPVDDDSGPLDSSLPDLASDSTPIDGGSIWTPSSAEPIHFHWMIGGFSEADILPNQNGPVVYDIDGENSTAADVAAIHAAGAVAVCYVDVGTLEQGRSDYAQFPSSVVGPADQGWTGENWLLVTAANQSIILPLMEARFRNWCQAKGFDAVEPDNLDAWTNISGITQADNVSYDLAIGKAVHALQLSVGLKNVLTDVSGSDFSNFVSAFDWALNEQCYENSECDAYTQAGSFIPSGKAVWDVEYNVAPDCAQANQARLNAQLTDLDLVGATSSGYMYTPCVPDSQSTW
ncbi:MAG: endo alpha-1,4 polygalactosaminidase [Polyangiaceae bacterium]